MTNFILGENPDVKDSNKLQKALNKFIESLKKATKNLL